MLASVPGFTDEAWMLRRASGDHGVRFDAGKIGPQGAPPVSPRRTSRLTFAVTAEEASQSRERLSLERTPENPQHGQPTDAITGEVLAVDGLRISGPHDVLRWLADVLEATWF